ncbi:MAG TPA: ATP-binding protein [Solirubrobacterales bacterium]
MPVELAEIAAGLPFAASLAMATGITALREGRRRTSLNEALHELRRPLQALALSLPADSGGREAAGSALRMTAAAVERLDREINGEASPAASDRVPVRPLVEAALARWRPRAAVAGRPLELTWEASRPVLRGDGVALAQAVDNLISNGFEHGLGAVEVEVREEEGLLRLAVRDGGEREEPAGRSARLARRHGHGLKIVRRVAASQGGTFRLKRSCDRTEAELVLPLAGRPR